MSTQKMFRSNSPYSFILALMLGVTLAVSVSVWATTVGNSVTVSGGLTVNGGSTLGDASTDVNLFTGTLQASTTALFTGAVTTYGDGTLGDAAGDTLTVNASTTVANSIGLNGEVAIGNAQADNVTINAGVVNYTNVSTSTIPSANANAFNVATTSANIPLVKFDTSNTRVGIGTTTPGATLAVGGDGTAIIIGGATSSLSIQSTGASKGGCIEVESTAGDGTRFSLMATGAGIVYWTTGGCR